MTNHHQENLQSARVNDKQPFRAFLCGLYPAEVLQQRQKIIDRLLWYVLEGTRDPYGSRARCDKAPTLTNAVNAAMFLQSQPQMRLTKGQQTKVPVGDTIEMVLQSFERVVSRNNVDKLTVPPFDDAALSTAFAKRIKASPDSWDDADPSIKGAFELAKINLIRAKTRFVSLSVIATLLKRTEWDTVILDGLDEIRYVLHLRKSEFVKRVMLFGGLLGGAGAAEALKMACHQMVYDPVADVSYSTIEYLSCDGIRPGHWPSSADESFRAEIKKAYGEL